MACVRLNPTAHGPCSLRHAADTSNRRQEATIMPTMCRKKRKSILKGAQGYCDATCDNPGAGRKRGGLRFGPRRLPGDLVPIIEPAPLRVGDRRPARRQPVRVHQLRRTNKHTNKQTGMEAAQHAASQLHLPHVPALPRADAGGVCVWVTPSPGADVASGVWVRVKGQERQI